MPDCFHRFDPGLPGHVCLVGLGNPDRGDDAFGVRLAEAIEAGLVAGASRKVTAPGVGAGTVRFIMAGTQPERWLGTLCDGGFDHVVFLDAADFGAAPGSMVWLGAAELTARFPQVSTHRLSLGLLASMIEAQGRARAWLLGVQPATLREASTSPANRDGNWPGSAAVWATLQALRDVLVRQLQGREVERVVVPGRSCPPAATAMGLALSRMESAC